QNEAYAERYLSLVKCVEESERAKVPGSHDLTEAAVRYYFELLAIKDEYEVARLYSDGSFAKQVAAAFEGEVRVEFHLAPPVLGHWEIRHLQAAKGEEQSLLQQFRASPAAVKLAAE